MRAKQDAERQGQALLKQMKGAGWRLIVFENIGWHYFVHNGPLSMHPAGESTPPLFYACLGDPRYIGVGDDLWSSRTSPVYADPNEAAVQEVKYARRAVEAKLHIIEAGERVVLVVPETAREQKRPQ